jgi:hypothetical protein
VQRDRLRQAGAFLRSQVRPATPAPSGASADWMVEEAAHARAALDAVNAEARRLAAA